MWVAWRSIFSCATWQFGCVFTPFVCGLVVEYLSECCCICAICFSFSLLLLLLLTNLVIPMANVSQCLLWELLALHLKRLLHRHPSATMVCSALFCTDPRATCLACACQSLSLSKQRSTNSVVASLVSNVLKACNV
ncbi:hypothetical protein EDD86DRAFT_98214 [Gorgonomyces haynaldii]|nr:hypothetical protein EDD86DRAFT_98214 [Gorgonomyces haynaldii]